MNSPARRTHDDQLARPAKGCAMLCPTLRLDGEWISVIDTGVESFARVGGKAELLADIFDAHDEYDFPIHISSTPIARVLEHLRREYPDIASQRCR